MIQSINRQIKGCLLRPMRSVLANLWVISGPFQRLPFRLPLSVRDTHTIRGCFSNCKGVPCMHRTLCLLPCKPDIRSLPTEIHSGSRPQHRGLGPNDPAHHIHTALDPRLRSGSSSPSCCQISHSFRHLLTLPVALRFRT